MKHDRRVLDGDEQCPWTDPDARQYNESHYKMTQFAVNVKCVNDPAERAIKFISDCLDTVEEERGVQDLMPVH